MVKKKDKRPLQANTICISSVLASAQYSHEQRILGALSREKGNLGQLMLKEAFLKGAMQSLSEE